MLTLKKSQVDFRRDLIFITDPKWPDDERASKGIPMSTRVRDALQKWIGETDGEWFFPSANNPARHRQQMNAIRHFNILCEKVGSKGLSIHKLRHTFGTRVGDAGYSTQEIADLMGHADIRMARIYVHTSRDRQRSAVESVWGQNAKVIQMEKSN
jgi:integrase